MSADSTPSDLQPDELENPGDSTHGTVTYSYDSGGRITYVHDSQDRTVGADSGGRRGPVPVKPSSRLFQWEHLKEKRLFALTDLDGGKADEPEYWRDNPTRYLVVEVDEETGDIKPAAKNRQPVYLWLCREEREAR
jgi:YD repeat-containing protein